MLAGILAGKSLETIQSELKLSDWSDLKMFEAWRPLNIEGAYRGLVKDDYLLLRSDVEKPASRE